MLARIGADAVLIVHLLFIAFAFAGAWLALRWPGVLFVQLPAAAWAVWIELSGRLCPLTGLENDLRRLAGESGYSQSFVEHYLLGIIYPDGLTRGIQLALAAVVLVLNGAAWYFVWRRRSRT